MVVDPSVVEGDLIQCFLYFTLNIENGYSLLLELLLCLKADLLTYDSPAVRY